MWLHALILLVEKKKISLYYTYIFLKKKMMMMMIYKLRKNISSFDLHSFEFKIKRKFLSLQNHLNQLYVHSVDLTVIFEPAFWCLKVAVKISWNEQFLKTSDIILMFHYLIFAFKFIKFLYIVQNCFIFYAFCF